MRNVLTLSFVVFIVALVGCSTTSCQSEDEELAPTAAIDPDLNFNRWMRMRWPDVEGAPDRWLKAVRLDLSKRYETFDPSTRRRVSLKMEPWVREHYERLCQHECEERRIYEEKLERRAWMEQLATKKSTNETTRP